MWTPKPCYEAETAHEFHEWVTSDRRKFGAFPFFLDNHARVHIADEHALSKAYGQMIHTAQEEHLGHCTFIMRRWNHIAENGQSAHVIQCFASYMHTKHCSLEILRALARPDLDYKGPLPDSTFGIFLETC